MAKDPKGKKASAYRSVGTTSDGVRILKPKTKPTSFTSAEIRATIRKVLRDRQGGRFETQMKSGSGASPGKVG